MKVSELSGAALDWAVAKALGVRTYVTRYEHTMTGVCILDAELVDMRTDGAQELRYSRDWAQGGPIIEREGICPDRLANKSWLGIHRGDINCKMYGGATPLIAAMRCYVASKLGDEVDVPKELIPPANKDQACC